MYTRCFIDIYCLYITKFFLLCFVSILFRLQKDINNLKKDIEKLEQGWKKAFHNQLSEASCLYLKEVEAAVEKAVNSSPSKNQCFPPEKMTTVLVDRIKKELQGCAQRHLKAVERSLPGVLTLQFKQQQQNLQALHQSFLDGVNSSVQLATKSVGIILRYVFFL